MSTLCKESRSICILKEKGVCLKVPFQTGPPPKPIHLSIPYFEFVAQTRMNRTRTCDVFIRGDIVRIYAEKLSKASNFTAVITVFKRKSSLLYMYKRNVAEVMRYLPGPTSEEPLHRVVQVEALGFIFKGRASSQPVDCFKLSLRDTESEDLHISSKGRGRGKGKSTSKSGASSSSERTGSGNPSTIWVEKGLYEATDAAAEQTTDLQKKSSSPLVSVLPPQQSPPPPSPVSMSLPILVSNPSSSSTSSSVTTTINTATTPNFTETTWLNEDFVCRPALVPSNKPSSMLTAASSTRPTTEMLCEDTNSNSSSSDNDSDSDSDSSCCSSSSSEDEGEEDEGEEEEEEDSGTPVLQVPDYGQHPTRKVSQIPEWDYTSAPVQSSSVSYTTSPSCSTAPMPHTPTSIPYSRTNSSTLSPEGPTVDNITPPLLMLSNYPQQEDPPASRLASSMQPNDNSQHNLFPMDDSMIPLSAGAYSALVYDGYPYDSSIYDLLDSQYEESIKPETCTIL